MSTHAPALPRDRETRLSVTLSAYLGRLYLGWLVALFLAFFGIIVLANSVDLLDRLATKNVSLVRVIEMALLKAPHIAMEVMPFLVLFSGLAIFTKLTRTHELVVARAAGVSAWQFLFPVIFVVLGVGIFVITLMNPISATLLDRYERLEARFVHNDDNLLAVSKTGLWLRQVAGGKHWVIHAQRVNQQAMTLYDVIVFKFDGPDAFQSRIDAKTAELQDGHWALTGAWVSQPGETSEFDEEVRIPTDFTREKIFESFAPPETISFWSLPEFIALLEEAGFSSQAHRLQFHRLLSLPLLLAAMILLSAVFSLKPHRRGRVGLSLMLGVLSGFLLYFLSNFVFALGLSGKIPVVLAAWMPAGVALMIGAALLLHLEDG
ncbi:MAG: LPS export ABC transporter permease LptG [Rhodovibrionaceae bacterium]|nr:LPS export ABC transporter permease LptG [Rhodovibrionaceae bacterium]